MEYRLLVVHYMSRKGSSRQRSLAAILAVAWLLLLTMNLLDTLSRRATLLPCLIISAIKSFLCTYCTWLGHITSHFTGLALIAGSVSDRFGTADRLPGAVND